MEGKVSQPHFTEHETDAYDDWVKGETLSPLANLRYLEYFHISLLRSSAFSPLFVPSEVSIIKLVTQCSPNIKQCGVDNKVWTVSHNIKAYRLT
jgi:hypothetical protein